MPVVSIGGKKVVESGAFVVSGGAMNAELVLAGTTVTLEFDKTLAPSQGQASQGAKGPHIKVGPLESLTWTVQTMNLNTPQGTFDLSFYIGVVNGNGKSQHAVQYTLTQ